MQATKAKVNNKRRKKVLFTPKDLMIFVLAFMYTTTYLSIDSFTKIMLFMLYTMVSLMAIMLYREF